MEASVAFVEEFGERTGNQMLWATYAGNACTECLALLVVIISVVGLYLPDISLITLTLTLTLPLSLPLPRSAA